MIGFLQGWYQIDDNKDGIIDIEIIRSWISKLKGVEVDRVIKECDPSDDGKIHFNMLANFIENEKNKDGIFYRELFK